MQKPDSEALCRQWAESFRAALPFLTFALQLSKEQLQSSLPKANDQVLHEIMAPNE